MANKNNKNLTWRDVWKLPFHIDTPDYCLYIFDKTYNTMVYYLIVVQNLVHIYKPLKIFVKS